ncbi:MAG: helix-turn-helix domain-containing protein [Planctomycetales bacterium]|nr:helix-turn-helix domain-containing protein [Planctomycetales bacterium]
MSKRIWIVWLAQLGRSEPGNTAETSLCRRTVQQWVPRDNEAGLVGLQDRPGQGRKPPLSPAEEYPPRQRIEAELQRNDEVCSQRGVDFQRFIETQFGTQLSLSAFASVG